MPEKIIEIKSLSVEFHTAHGIVSAVSDVSWDLSRGETLAILGESGSGKSVTASAIMDLIDTPPGKITSGEIKFKGSDLLNMNADQRRKINGKKIAMIFQDPLSHLNPVHSIGFQIEEILLNHGVSKTQANERALELLERVGIPDPGSRIYEYPHQFSGGQRQRIMIAMALALKPDVLIADEPTTALDVTVQAQILRLLRELQIEYGMGILLITHDLGVVAEVADRVVVMKSGKIVETGTAEAVYHNPQHDYTKRLIAAAPGTGVLNSFNHEGAKPLLTVEKLCKNYGAVEALSNISFQLHAKETLAIVGESGSGKSTLAKCLLRLTDVSGGSAFYKSDNLLTMDEQSLFKIRREIQMVFQDPTQSLNPRMNVYQIISEAFAIHPEILERSYWRDEVANLLSQVGLEADHMNRYPHQFSGGQRQRIAIARALALRPKIIICDEAVSALDVSIQAQVIELLRDLQNKHDLSYVFIAHDLPVVRDFAHKVIVMQSGRIVEYGSVEQTFDHPESEYTRTLMDASLDPDPVVQRGKKILRDEVIS